MSQVKKKKKKESKEPTKKNVPPHLKPHLNLAKSSFSCFSSLITTSRKSARIALSSPFIAGFNYFFNIHFPRWSFHAWGQGPGPLFTISTYPRTWLWSSHSWINKWKRRAATLNAWTSSQIIDEKTNTAAEERAEGFYKNKCKIKRHHFHPFFFFPSNSKNKIKPKDN